MSTSTTPRSRRFGRRLPAFATTAALAAGTLTACGASQAEEASAEAFTVGVFRGVPRGMDPAFAGLPYGFTLLQVLEPLVTVDVTTGEFRPNLAESFEQPDPSTYVFQLRQDVQFSDGTPLTVDDVVYSLNIHLDPAEESALAGDFASVASIEATGEHEVTVSMREPSILFLTFLASAGVLKQEVRETQGDSRGTPSALPVGTGPYTITEFSPSELAVLERNDEYWGDPAAFEELSIQIMSDPNTALAAYRAGELDAVFDVPALRVEEFEGGGTIHRAIDPEFTQVFLNPAIPPFDDVNVRRAIIHSIDREGLINSIYGGAASIADSIVSPPLLETLMSEEEAAALLDEVAIPYDMDLAREALAASGHPDGFTVDTVVNAAEPELRQFALAISDNLAELGIELRFEEISQTQYTDTVFLSEPHTVGFGISTYGFNSYTPYEQLLGLTLPSYANLADYSTPEVDALATQLRSTPIDDTEQIAELVSALVRENGEDAVYGTVLTGENLAAVRDGYVFENYSAAWPLGHWFREVGLEG